MQGTTEEAEASISTENMREGPNPNGAFAEHRKAAKRTLPWDLASGELDLVAHIPTRKKPRIEEPLPTTTDEAAKKLSSHDAAISLPAADADHADADPMTGTQVTGHWTPEEDAKMDSHSIEQSEAIIPMEVVSSGSPTMLRSATTTRLCRKVARRTESWYPQPPPPPPRRSTRRIGKKLPRYFEEEIPARKKPRVEEALPTTRATTRDQAVGKTGSPDASVGLHPPAADNDDANADPDAQPNTGTGSWRLEEDAKLTSAVTNTSKEKCGKDYKTNWVAVAALVPSRSRIQCRHRWHDVLDPSIGRASGRAGKWTEDEDSKLKNAVQTLGDKDWVSISALVPGRTKKQCNNRWHDALHPSIDRVNGRTGKWTEDEDSKLKDAVQTLGDKNWGTIAAQVHSRTKKQCWDRWKDALDPSVDRANARAGKWTEDEDIKLKEAVQMRGDKDWVAISVLVPGRTQKQCNSRWKDILDPSIGRANGRTGKWAEDEVAKLKHAVRTYGDKNWKEVAALVPGRTKKQCCDRWLR
jgi:ribosome recycling factor